MDPERIGRMKVVPVCGCFTCCGLLIFACIALPMSFKSLEQGFYALNLDWVTQQIGDEVVTEPGMKQVGLGNMLVEFPSTFVTMHFKAGDIRGPIRARSLDGLEMHVSVSFQYRLEPTSLKPLYTILGDHLYEDEFIRFARAGIVEACAQFRAEQFFTNRTLITGSMLEVLGDGFKQPAMNLDAAIKGLQLGTVDLPDEFETEIQNMMSQQQEVEVAKAERVEKTIVKNREMLIATQEVKRKVEIARGDAEDIRLNNAAVVRQIIVQATKKSTANQLILTEFLDDEHPYSRLLEIMEVRMMESHDASKMMINL